MSSRTVFIVCGMIYRIAVWGLVTRQMSEKLRMSSTVVTWHEVRSVAILDITHRPAIYLEHDFPFSSWGGVEPTPLRPLLPDDECGASVQLKYPEKTCLTAAFFTTNPTWPGSGSNPCRRSGKPAELRHGQNTAFRRLDCVSVFKWNLLRWAQ
jgi:hypothetical protein